MSFYPKPTEKTVNAVMSDLNPVRPAPLVCNFISSFCELLTKCANSILCLMPSKCI